MSCLLRRDFRKIIWPGQIRQVPEPDPGAETAVIMTVMKKRKPVSVRFIRNVC